jgi:hypothetical protein
MVLESEVQPPLPGSRSTSSLEKVLENQTRVVEEGFTRPGALKYRSYAITALRGGVGKSTLAFNLSFEISGLRSLLVADLCAQRNLSETLMRGVEIDVSTSIVGSCCLLAGYFSA